MNKSICHIYMNVSIIRLRVPTIHSYIYSAMYSLRALSTHGTGWLRPAPVEVIECLGARQVLMVQGFQPVADVFQVQVQATADPGETVGICPFRVDPVPGGFPCAVTVPVGNGGCMTCGVQDGQP